MEIDGRKDWYSPKRSIVECVGTFTITYFPLMASVFVFTGESTILSHALCAGFMVTVWAWIGRERSGGHYNPAITIGYAYLKQIPFPTALIYVLAQLVGGAFAGGCIFWQLSEQSK